MGMKSIFGWGAEDLRYAIVGGTVYFATVVSTMVMTGAGRGIATTWPGNAVLLALIVTLPARRWPIYLVAGIVAHVGGNMVARGALTAPIGYGIANMVELIVAATLIRLRAPGANMLANLNAIMWFTLCGLLAPAISGIIGALTATLTYGEPFWRSYRLWVTSDALGLLIFTPLFLALRTGEVRIWLANMDGRRRAQAALWFAVTAATAAVAFLGSNMAMLFLVMAPVMATTISLGRFGTKTCVVIVAMIGGVSTIYGYGPIVAMTPSLHAQAQFFQFYLATLLLTMLPAAAELHARRASAEHFEQAASTDSLTGVLSRASFIARLEARLVEPRGVSLALVLIDVDLFKRINDSHGHPAGDALLVEIARRLGHRLRKCDLIGRLGGDEFAILVEGVREDQAEAIAEDSERLIGSSPVRLRDNVVEHASISCGVAFARPSDDWRALVERADDALYRTKRLRKRERALQG
jgi:diguanylate cyclase (GGDEF)-like protein